MDKPKAKETHIFRNLRNTGKTFVGLKGSMFVGESDTAEVSPYMITLERNTREKSKTKGGFEVIVESYTNELQLEIPSTVAVLTEKNGSMPYNTPRTQENEDGTTQKYLYFRGTIEEEDAVWKGNLILGRNAMFKLQLFSRKEEKEYLEKTGKSTPPAEAEAEGEDIV